MKFYVSKCKVVHYGNGNMVYNYSMEDLPVEEVDCEKDHRQRSRAALY